MMCKGGATALSASSPTSAAAAAAVEAEAASAGNCLWIMSRMLRAIRTGVGKSSANDERNGSPKPRCKLLRSSTDNSESTPSSAIVCAAATSSTPSTCCTCFRTKASIFANASSSVIRDNASQSITAAPELGLCRGVKNRGSIFINVKPRISTSVLPSTAEYMAMFADRRLLPRPHLAVVSTCSQTPSALAETPAAPANTRTDSARTGMKAA